MGSTGSGAGDYSIGPIVWVRRRNGSWWPGKILGPDELAECNLTSPRTGTPVKLLGREDASVDWYNLEKSKRVKAFRCGEFDDCIERAEAAQGMPIKKREKYARREDAIFHALELEKELLRKQGKLGGTDHPRSKSSGSAKEPVIASEGVANNDTGKTGITKLNQFLNRMDTNVKDESVCNSVKTKDEHQPISEDDHSEATPRMRGLQDLGLRTASLKRKNASPVRSDGSEKPMVDNHLHAHTVAASSMERTNHGNGGEQMGAVSRAKRSKCIYFPTETNDSLDDTEHPPNQIKTFEDNGSHPHNGSFNEQNSSSGFMEDIESDDSSETDSSESQSDSSETEPDVDDEMAIYPDACMHLEAERNVFRQPEAREHETTSSEDPDEYAFSSEMRHIYPDDPFFANEAVSKWQLKGKRNIRHLTKRSANRAAGRKALNAIPHEIYHRIRSSNSRQRAYSVGDTDFDTEKFGSQMFPLDNGHYSYKPRFVCKGRNTGHYAIDWRDLTREDRPTLKGSLEDRANHFNPTISGRHHFTGRTRSILVDVDLKVQASYQKERVPIVSLLSKLNGKAIIGHPIQIESLEDGSSENLVSTNDYPSTEMFDHEEIAPVPPAWRTARRTNFRVPRSHLSSVLGEDVVEDPVFMDQDGRSSPIRKLSMGGFNNKASLVRKSLPQTSRPPVDRKFARKLPKKASLSFNQKTRTLSSIAVQQNFGTKHMHYSSGSQMDGLLKPETGRPTAVACIPVKLVFSRLLEKINRPPSKAACKVVMSTGETEGQPS